MIEISNHDGLVRSRITTESVIPAKAGIQLFKTFWTPASAGVTLGRTFYEIIKP